jgi:hypothetical protein
MSRKLIVRNQQGNDHLLEERAAANEAQLQELVKDNPDLLPVDEFGMSGPVMTVGRETAVPSGAVDLVLLARGGELLLVEFKTGPQNSDFRCAIAQLLDYGSHIWGLSFEDFEQTVPVRYFAGPHCKLPVLKGLKSIEQAAQKIWLDFSEQEMSTLRDQLTRQLRDGAFHYVLVAQRFTSTIERTIQYLNATHAPGKYYAVELVHFSSDDGVTAFESRTILSPVSIPIESRVKATVDEANLLAQIGDERYAFAVREFFERCRALDLAFGWGTVGASIRVKTPARAEPVTAAWFFPPDKSGWMGFKDMQAGYDRVTLAKLPSILAEFERYAKAIEQIPEGEDLNKNWFHGRHLSPDAFIKQSEQILDALTTLANEVNNPV